MVYKVYISFYLISMFLIFSISIYYILLLVYLHTNAVMLTDLRPGMDFS